MPGQVNSIEDPWRWPTLRCPQHPLFVARADWRDEGQYRRADLLDPSIWSWEFLRRSDEYAQERGYTWQRNRC
ncbi:transcriptional regulator domain-containing protein [Burkholderia metallica]|uniref:transcriptional regulator domain-containing protein n=1 Tax=Burkholderia metallica TaxID=488729 RepID=UPI003451F1A8